MVPRPFLFLVLEAGRPLLGGARFALTGVLEVIVSRGSRRECVRTRSDRHIQMQVTVPSSYLSARHARLRQTVEGWVVEDLESRNGVVVNGKQVSRAVLRPGDVFELGRVFFSIGHHDVPGSWDADPWSSDINMEEFDLNDAGLLTLVPTLSLRIARLRTEALSPGAVTIVGETGTGKELLARAIHRLSRRKGPYLGINCAAIPRDLIQSELFGRTKGAFTGATSGFGYLRDADWGTLLLDEIIWAPREVQLALLRAIQEKTVTPLGGTRPHHVDVRILAATQDPLAQAVVTHGFRPDLRARLEEFVFELPPLRRRREDIGLLIAHALRSMGVTERDKPRLSAEAATDFVGHDWPMNIRELANAVTRSWGGAQGSAIVEAEIQTAAAPVETSSSPRKDELIAILRATHGNVSEASRRMGRARPLVHRWLNKFGIDADSFRR
jgi:transcriptional regulator with GAF, ATPase, and Fis domain